MTSKFVSVDRFRRLAQRDDADGVAVQRLGSVVRQAAVGSRTKRFVFSDSSVDRMGDSIRANGWQYRDFMRNPVCLWSHDITQPPIGKVTNIFVAGGKLVGDIRFAAAETYQFADDVFRLIDTGYINAVSVGFTPIEYEMAKSPDRRGGVNFIKQELLEISVVSLPANANALLEGRSYSSHRAADDPIRELGRAIGGLVRAARQRNAPSTETTWQRAARARLLRARLDGPDAVMAELRRQIWD